MSKATEQRAAQILLKRGVPVSIEAPLLFRWLGCKSLKLKIHAPTTHTLLIIAEKYASLQIKEEQVLNVGQSFELLKNNGKKISEIIAVAVLNSPTKLWRHKILARFIERKLTPEEISHLFHLIVVYGGVEDFINTIRLVDSTRITKPMNLSPQEKMS